MGTGERRSGDMRQVRASHGRVTPQGVVHNRRLGPIRPVTDTLRRGNPRSHRAGEPRGDGVPGRSSSTGCGSVSQRQAQQTLQPLDVMAHGAPRAAPGPERSTGGVRRIHRRTRVVRGVSAVFACRREPDHPSALAGRLARLGWSRTVVAMRRPVDDGCHLGQLHGHCEPVMSSGLGGEDLGHRRSLPVRGQEAAAVGDEAGVVLDGGCPAQAWTSAGWTGCHMASCAA